ncbi:MAG: murein biosynthesis integral membrane protein MurJ [Rhodospirillaceae bacterium]|jgi:putative peptidoglycan lipid II flippase|nr:murein biosynthesis integral membrane protein MurJ [Rhodospirillaceae bacterium]MBT3493850.1 murein biosynthesis integral membrane protein MurJ [Rhodospirillaceae bacterium]MBT3779842.1 murein biosynthesis integral membrane protein MurJ [Rhodospirillaceae bacterium]MBT3977114.1 murein biosynthesis integral membrane protein MurJ [Rhodospirillaceae bacterium]MBT4168761.1 murein biosynthesis integral membrane protein MurJ [Rhodospirillaceae bacterium]
MNLFRAFATVGGYTMLSRILGFVRDILIAGTLGAGPVADAFFVAFKLPNFFRRLFAEGAFNAGFVPLFSDLLANNGPAQARAFAEQALSFLLLTLFIFVTLAQLTMPWLMQALAPGFVDDPERFDLAVAFTRITFPYLLFISLVSLMGGVLNSLQRFAAVAATPVLLNICLIAAITLLSPHLPSPGHALAWGVAVAGVVQLVWLSIACQRAGMGLRLPRPRLTPKIRELLRLMLPAALGAGVVQVNLVIDIILASLLPKGSVSFLFYADRLNQLPIGVVGVAVGTAILPLLSRLVAQKDQSAALQALNRAIELTLFLALPAMFAFLLTADELILTLFQRGQFDAAAVRATAFALTAYAVGLPAYVLVKVLGPAFFARRDTRTPVLVGIGAMVVNVILNLILMQFLAHAGLALATAIAAWLNVGLLSWILYHRGDLVPDHRLIQRLGRALGAALIMTLILWWLKDLLAAQFLGDGEIQRILALAVLVAAGMLSYAVSAVLLRAVRWHEIKALLAGRR